MASNGEPISFDVAGRNDHDQRGYSVRFEWGANGVETIAPISDVVVLVDVLSFSTCVDIAVSRGSAVYPYPSGDESARRYSAARDALLASRDRHAPDGFSLSPASLLRVPAGSRLVLPSPNGSALSFRMRKRASTLTSCLRNRKAVASAASKTGETVCVIACGERWPDGSLRPSIEDMVGAGSLIECLPGSRSPEAESALSVWEGCERRPESWILSCSSGRELLARGFERDVELASEVDVSSAVPGLVEDAYTDHAGRGA